MPRRGQAPAKLSVKDRKKLVDGATFWTDDDLPENHMTDPVTGLRPGHKTKPTGWALIDLNRQLSGGYILPTRAKWKEGHWQDNKSPGTDPYYTWIVDADGTPGNYLFRHYLLPSEIATVGQVPKHPSDWPQTKQPKGYSSYAYQQTSGNTASKAPSLPFGVRFQCPGCGHWYKESDLAGHATVCPKTSGGEAGWAIACECPCESLDLTAKCKPGFPKPKPEAAKGETDDAKLVSHPADKPTAAKKG